MSKLNNTKIMNVMPNPTIKIIKLLNNRPIVAPIELISPRKPTPVPLQSVGTSSKVVNRIIPHKPQKDT